MFDDPSILEEDDYYNYILSRYQRSVQGLTKDQLDNEDFEWVMFTIEVLKLESEREEKEAKKASNKK